MPAWLACVLVFLTTCAIDVVWVWFNRFVAAKRAHAAALMSVAMGGLGLVGFLAVVESRWMLIPDLAGLYAGTWLGVAMLKDK